MKVYLPKLASVEKHDPFLPANERLRQIICQLRTATVHLVAVVVVARVAGTLALWLAVPCRAVAPNDLAEAFLKPSRLRETVIEMHCGVAALHIQCAIACVPQSSVDPFTMLIVTDATSASVNAFNSESFQTLGRPQRVRTFITRGPKPVEVAQPAMLLTRKEQPG